MPLGLAGDAIVSNAEVIFESSLNCVTTGRPGRGKLPLR
jgi:hypothetical protein